MKLFALLFAAVAATEMEISKNIVGVEYHKVFIYNDNQSHEENQIREELVWSRFEQQLEEYQHVAAELAQEKHYAAQVAQEKAAALATEEQRKENHEA